MASTHRVPHAESDAKGLPVIQCRRARLPELSAKSTAIPWCELPDSALFETTTGAAPKQPTVVKLAWDPTEVRVFFQAADTHAWATLTERDAPLYEEEVVEVFLDPVGDLESYFEIEVNPLNAVLDLVLRRNRSGYVKDFAWQCERLRTAVTHGTGMWCAELAIPFRSLIAEPPRAGTRWRGNFSRIDRPNKDERELSAWSPTGRANFHTPERFGWIEFVC